MKVFCLGAAILLATTSARAQIYLQSRSDASCGHFSNRIYCYGGTPTNATVNNPDYLSMLDLSAYSGSSAEELENKWVTVNTMNDINTTQHRSHQQYMQYPDGNTLLVSGGNTESILPALKYQTLAFSVKEVAWKVYPSYEEQPYGVRQIFRASSVYVPDYGVGFFGGTETHYNKSTVFPRLNMTAYDNPTANLRYIGYTKLTFFDIGNKKNPWSIYPTQNNIPLGFPYHQKSIFDTKSNCIFFFGGVVKDTSGKTAFATTFSSSMTFNFTTGEWGSQALIGQGPTPRFGHSVTLLGTDQRHVLVYGGQGTSINDTVSSDYCYTLDLDTYQWTQQNIFAPAGVVLVRTQHSAVVVDYKTVFIIFGITEKLTEATLSILMLNVRDPLNITLNETYEKRNETTTVNNNEVKSSSQGKMIGIAVGVTAAGFLAIAAIVFWIIRKRKIAKKMEEALMEVDWDEIEQKYANSPSRPNGYSPRSDEGTTVVELLVPDALTPRLMQNDSKTQLPNAVDDSDQFVANQERSALQKPDGA